MLAQQSNENKIRSALSKNKEVRNLCNLGETASTSRVLNLAQIFIKSGQDKDYLAKPFFHDSQLNKAIILKHTLRPSERDLFTRARRTATKIIMPFDPLDLKLGGRSVFVNQTGFDAFARTYFNISDPSINRDVQILKLLDTLPSLDPFLVREQMSRHGYKPAPCYLKISNYDITHMIGFANAEIEHLVVTALGGSMKGAAIKLAGKILSDELDKELSPFKMTLRMNDEEFSDGIFSWRGFLYFKWRHVQLQGELKALIDGLKTYRPAQVAADEATKDYLNEVRPRLALKIMATADHIGRTLDIYNRAYKGLVVDHNPKPFRHFLLEGPSLFYELGESIGLLSHITSFWSYRMSSANQTKLTPFEYADVLMDFEDSMANIEISDETRNGFDFSNDQPDARVSIG